MKVKKKQPKQFENLKGLNNGEKEKSGKDKKEESRGKEEKAREAQAAREKEIDARINRAFAGDREDYF